MTTSKIESEDLSGEFMEAEEVGLSTRKFVNPKKSVNARAAAPTAFTIFREKMMSPGLPLTSTATTAVRPKVRFNEKQYLGTPEKSESQYEKDLVVQWKLV